MLKKLLKYDLKWIYKALIPFYILGIIFSIIGRFLIEIENSFIFNIIGQICIGATIAMVINILINNLMRVWARFIRNIYKDESYLTHTLPVSKTNIYLSKILSAFITMFTSALIIIICLLICYYSKETFEWLKNSLELIASNYNSTIVTFLITIAIVLFLEILFALFSGFLGIIIGHKSNSYKIIRSIIYGFILYMVASIVTLLALFIIGLFNSDVMSLFTSVTGFDINTVRTVLNGGIVMYICYIAIYYTIGLKLLKKGVDVD